MLGQWIGSLRARREDLSEDRCRRLEEIGFVWDVFSEQWEKGFLHLEAFYTNRGHCIVPHVYFKDGFKLGIWVSVQRRNYKALTEERRRRLDELGFVWKVK